MRIVHGSQEVCTVGRRSVVAVGNFDGVHLGHQALLARLRALAEQTRADAVVLTFRPHPAQILRPELAPRLLTDSDDERALLAAHGVELLVEEPFSPALAGLEPREFVDRILVERLRALAVVVGFNFRFGRGASGHFDDLRQLCARRGMLTEALPSVEVDGSPVSSTRVRRALQAGQVRCAHRLLGRPPRLSGAVVPGHQRGRTLGFPTLNLEPSTPLQHAEGVYAARAWLPGRAEPLGAAVSFGRRLTFGGGAVTVEAFLLDFSEDVYGQRVSLDLLDYLRPEQRFPDAEALIAAMRSDVDRTRRILAAPDPRVPSPCLPPGP